MIALLPEPRIQANAFQFCYGGQRLMNISLMFLFSISSQLIFFSDLKYASVKARCQELTDYADLSCALLADFTITRPSPTALMRAQLM